MTTIYCSRLDCLNNRRGKCCANVINLSERGCCTTATNARSSMRSTHSIVHKQSGKWRKSERRLV